MALPPTLEPTNSEGMTQNDAEWRLEMEESAQGTDFFEAPGRDVQTSEAKASATEFSAGETGSPSSVEKVRERRHSLSGAMMDLETMVSSPSAAEGWHESVGKALAELRLALDEHIAVTEGDGGLLAEILELAPRFSGEVALINAEHEGLIEALERAILTLEGTVEIGSDDPDPIRRRVMTVLGRLSLHRQRGADLIYDAYNVDIATAD